ncbi:hypothetical protein [Streptomyces sp. LUP30]|uniref:hypothetical protein n=1 Tax=Streptomyces sp. LUP30 TaxID=1890285 RepID=UPI000A7472A4|nr:hypothetical protein [Streptomyces sp. LUP30]
MPEDETDPLRAELDEALAQRDATRRELGDLRAWLCRELGILSREPGPEEQAFRSVASDEEIVAAVARLRAEIDALKQPTDGTDLRWSRIDYLILEGRRIQALQSIRDEFGGGIPEALDLLNNRSMRLRQERPEDFITGT